MRVVKNNDNRIIVNLNHDVIAIGYEAIPYFNIVNHNVICYEEGKVNLGDVIVIIKGEKCGFDESQNLNLHFMGIRNLQLNGEFVAIGRYFSEACSGVLFDEDIRELDTIVFGKIIKITKYNRAIEATLNNTTLEIKDTECLVAIFDKEKLKYLNVSNSIQEEISIIEKGFHSKFQLLDSEDILSLQGILDKSIYEGINLNIESDKCFMKYKGEVICIEWKKELILNNEIYVINISNKGKLLENIRKTTKKYDEIVAKEKDYKIVDDFSSAYQALGIDEHISRYKTIIKKASMSRVTIMITGESGTGKTYFAREIHRNSMQSGGPFIHINCASISPNLIESELFGYDEGSFTGAIRGGKKGYFEQAEDGTIFLDEIGELPYELQGKLLEVIQERTFYRVGGNAKIQAKCRFIAATNRDLRRCVDEGKFRLDLYYRINVFPIHLPPVRERAHDIKLIASTLLPNICNRLGIEPILISPQARNLMENYSWPGNIREIENVLEKATILCEGKIILPTDIEFGTDTLRKNINIKPLKDTIADEERKAIVNALITNNYEKKKTAEYLCISRTNLFEKMNKYKIRGGTNDCKKDSAKNR